MMKHGKVLDQLFGQPIGNFPHRHLRSVIREWREYLLKLHQKGLEHHTRSGGATKHHPILQVSRTIGSDEAMVLEPPLLEL